MVKLFVNFLNNLNGNSLNPSQVRGEQQGNKKNNPAHSYSSNKYSHDIDQQIKTLKNSPLIDNEVAKNAAHSNNHHSNNHHSNNHNLKIKPYLELPQENQKHLL